MTDELQIITDTDEAAKRIYSVLKQRNVERPRDLVAVLESLREEIDNHIAVAEKADFEATEKGNKAVAAEMLVDMFNWIARLRNDYAFAQNQIDTCRRAVVGEDRGDAAPNFVETEESVRGMLQQLAGDFDGWRMEHTPAGWDLVVLTKPVKLYCSRTHIEVPFGRFKIRLSLSQLLRGVARPYKLAAEAHTLVVRGYDIVPHPHVRSGKLCEGDGEPAITRALRNGNLFALFLIIDQTLNTYNQRSPYVHLEEFAKLYRSKNPSAVTGVDTRPQCSRCHGHHDENELFPCNNCGNRICDNCSVYCEHGDISICSACRDSMHTDGCEDCEAFGTESCPVRSTIECSDCDEDFDGHDLIWCYDHGRRSMCPDCAVERAAYRNMCCNNWNSRCPIVQHMRSRQPTHEFFNRPEVQERLQTESVQQYIGIAENLVRSAISQPRATGTTCADCNETHTARSAEPCNGTYRCRDCLRSRIEDRDPCCINPVRGCAYGVEARRVDRDYYNSLPDGSIPQLMGAESNVPRAARIQAGTGFGPPANG